MNVPIKSTYWMRRNAASSMELFAFLSSFFLLVSLYCLLFPSVYTLSLSVLLCCHDICVIVILVCVHGRMKQ